MKLAAKFTSIIILGIIILLLIDGYILVQRQIRLFESDVEYEAHMVGHSLKDVVVDVWNKDGQEEGLKVIEDANRGEHRVRIRWVWLDAAAGNIYGPAIEREKLNPVIEGKDISFKEINEEGFKYFYLYMPVAVNTQRRGALELSESLSQVAEYTHHIFISVAILTSILILLSAFAVPLLGIRMVGRPLKLMIDKMRRIGNGDFTSPLQLERRDELGEIAAGLNAMSHHLQELIEKLRIETEAKIEALEQLRHEDRLKMVGRLASGVTHDVGTPLNVISGRADMIAKGNLPAEEVIDSANIIRAQSERITAMIRQLLDFARRHSIQKTLVDLRQIIQQTINLMSPLARKEKVDIKFVREDTPAMASVDSEHIQQVLMNIIANALQAMPSGGKVEVGIRSEYVQPPEKNKNEEGNYFCIYVQDEGKGIPKEDMSRIFEPFFTTKETGEGTGLGLSIALGIISEHGGWIDVKSEAGKGSCFSVYLPQENDSFGENS